MHSTRKRHLNLPLKKEYEGGGEVTMCKDKCPGRQDGLGLTKEQVLGREGDSVLGEI